MNKMLLRRLPAFKISPNRLHDVDGAKDYVQRAVLGTFAGEIKEIEPQQQRQPVVVFSEGLHKPILLPNENYMQENSAAAQNPNHRAICEPVTGTAAASADCLSLATQRSKQYVIKNISDAMRRTETRVKAVFIQSILFNEKYSKTLLNGKSVDIFARLPLCRYAAQAITNWLMPSTRYRTKCSELAPAR